MLSTPKHGWSSLKIGQFERSCSYLTDPMLDVADLLGKAIRHENGVAHFDAEGAGTYDLVYSDESFYIVSRAETTSVIDLDDISLPALVKEFVTEIKQDIEAWADWDGYLDKAELEAEHPKNLQRIKNALVPLEVYLRYEGKETSSDTVGPDQS